MIKNIPLFGDFLSSAFGADGLGKNMADGFRTRVSESGFGRDQFKRGLMDLEHQFIGAERDYWSAVGGGADTMTAQIGLLESNLAQQERIGGTSTTEMVGTLLDKLV